MAKPRLYLETTIPSYLTAWPSRDPYVAGQQQITKDWWQKYRDDFDLCISQFVWMESAAGDADAAEKRLEVLKPFPMLDANEAMERLAAEILELKLIPEKAERDAAHIAICAVHQIDFLMTWNCKHIANGQIIKVVRKICARHGVECPQIHTPAELMGN